MDYAQKPVPADSSRNGLNKPRLPQPANRTPWSCSMFAEHSIRRSNIV